MINTFLRTYGFTILISLIGWGLTGWGLGWNAFVITMILSVMEISLSFDNAVVNAKVLKNMTDAWQKVFLTLGMVIAVFGVRLILPVLLVAAFSHMSLAAVTDLVLHHPKQYGDVLHDIHPEIAAFGGVFLLMLFLDYIMEKREILWLGEMERGLAKAGRIKGLEIIITVIALLISTLLAPGLHHWSMLVSGIVGLLIYMGLNAFNQRFEQTDITRKAATAGLASFIYLEVLDASFSLDGVLGAFAITSNIIVITVGLGIGALWVRSMTIHLVKTDTLANYRYLEHGAHYAIGVLALLLLASASYEISELITGLAGFLIILAALVDSIRFNRRKPASA